jgi:asparagine synthase (glutamine-hydrolysing)
MNRWGAWSTLRELLNGTSFSASLASAADTVATPTPRRIEAASLNWTGRPRMPPWATAEAVETVRRRLRESAVGLQPLDPDRLRHQILEYATVSGRGVRQLNAALARFGVGWEAPYLDDRVIEATLSVRIEDRMAWGRYKPVLTTAMRGHVPDAVLDRRTKGEFSAEAYEGLRRSQEALVAQCDDMHLTRLGLVDADALRAALLNPGPQTRDLIPFENTLSCETWLRSPSAATPQTNRSSGRPLVMFP